MALLLFFQKYTNNVSANPITTMEPSEVIIDLNIKLTIPTKNINIDII